MIEQISLRDFKIFAELDLPLRPLTLLSGLNGMGKSTLLQALLVMRQSYQSGDLEQRRLRLNGPLVELGTAGEVLHYQTIPKEDRDETIEIGLKISETKKEYRWRFGIQRSGADTLKVVDTDIIPDPNASRESEFPEPDSSEESRPMGDPNEPLIVDEREESITIILGRPSAARKLYEREESITLDRPNATRELYEREEIGIEKPIALFWGDFQYIQAERLGPRLLHPASDYEVRQHRWLGRAGEYTAHYLHVFGDDPVLPSLVYDPNEKNTLLAQTAAWLGVVSPTVKLRTEFITGTDMVKLQFGYGVGEYFRPTNVGFGLSYALPIVVALLSANQGTLLLLENPEAHLHPRGQSELGRLIARAAAAGVQVIVETHSDHILNGIRIAVRQGLVSPDDVALHFFARPAPDSGWEGAEVISPEIDQDGRISEWPADFFDEHGRNLRQLF